MAFSSFRVSSLLMLCPLTEICALSFSFLIFQMRITVICRWIVMRIAWDNAWKGFALCLIHRKHSGNISCGDIDSNDDDQDNGFVAKSFKISGFKQIYNQWEGELSTLWVCIIVLLCVCFLSLQNLKALSQSSRVTQPSSPIISVYPVCFPYSKQTSNSHLLFLVPLLRLLSETRFL